ncbi:MAG: FAD-binding protein, partial [Acidobacteriota bacterium]
MLGQQRTVRSQQPVYDAVIIGSGAAGGTAAWVLVNAGLKVAMLETGPLRKDQVDFAYHDPFPYEDEYRGLKTETPRSEEFQKRYSMYGPTKDE